MPRSLDCQGAYTHHKRVKYLRKLSEPVPAAHNSAHSRRPRLLCSGMNLVQGDLACRQQFWAISLLEGILSYTSQRRFAMQRPSCVSQTHACGSRPGAPEHHQSLGQPRIRHQKVSALSRAIRLTRGLQEAGQTHDASLLPQKLRLRTCDSHSRTRMQATWALSEVRCPHCSKGSAQDCSALYIACGGCFCDSFYVMEHQEA